MSRYHINVFYSEEDGCFIADVPDLGGCSAFSPTPEKALAEALAAQRLWLEVAREDGTEIPEPCYRPIAYRAVMA